MVQRSQRSKTQETPTGQEGGNVAGSGNLYTKKGGLMKQMEETVVTVAVAPVFLTFNRK